MSYDEIVIQKMALKYHFIRDSINSDKKKQHLSVISESENENNKSYSKLDSISKINVNLSKLIL
jgi:hypothetical protein